MRNIKPKSQGVKFAGQRGQTAILMALFVLSVLILIALAASGVMVMEIKMTRQISDSVPAFYAADAGAERCLYQARRGAAGDPCFASPYTPINNITLGNNATFSVIRVSDKEIDATGDYLQTTRSVEVYWP